MKRLTVEYVLGLVEQRPKIAPNRRPVPFPGRKYPTRVAWSITMSKAGATRIGPSGPEWVDKGQETLRYCGKPNTYRTMQAHKFLRRSGWQPKVYWVAEFDRSGLVAYECKLSPLNSAAKHISNAYISYHPQTVYSRILDGFLKPVHVKKIGVGNRFALAYSLQKKLSLDKIDSYYSWFERTFALRLRRPRQAPMEIVGGQLVQPEQ